jgi:hypothetical protein
MAGLIQATLSLVQDRERPTFSFARIRVFPDSTPPVIPDPAAPAAPATPAAIPVTAETSPSPPAPAPVPAAPPSVHGEPASVVESCARLHWDRGRRLGSYRACGYAGFAAGFALVLALSAALGVTRAATAVVVLTVPLSFLLAVKVSALIFGYERIVFFEKALFALGATALALRILGQDVATGLDLATLGIGTFLGFGRVGCFMVGCCHGRPSRWGARYGVAHAQAGFPWYYVGRRLFPLQLVDGAVSLALVGAGVAHARSPHAPGSVAAGYLLCYGAARFVEEVFRGDAARGQRLGVSEAQWTAGFVAAAVAAIAYGAGFPRPHLELALALLLWAGVIALAVARRRGARTAWGLTSAWHVDELNRILVRLDRGARPLTSSQSLCISVRADAARGLRDYVLSFPDRPLPLRVAAALLEHVRFDRHPGERVELCAGATPGLVHVLVSASMTHTIEIQARALHPQRHDRPASGSPSASPQRISIRASSVQGSAHRSKALGGGPGADSVRES